MRRTTSAPWAPVYSSATDMEDLARFGSTASLAREAGMSRECLYKALSAGGNPAFATVVRIVRALGLRLHIA